MSLCSGVAHGFFYHKSTATSVGSPASAVAAWCYSTSVALRSGVGWFLLKSSRGPIQMNRKIAGNATTLVSRKNRTQPILSDSIPPEEATTVRPSKASEASSAY